MREISISKLERSIIQKLIAIENNQRYFEKDKNIAKEDTFIDMSISDFGSWLVNSFRRGFKNDFKDKEIKIDWCGTLWYRHNIGIAIKSKYNQHILYFSREECEFAVLVWDNHNTRGIDLEERLR